MNRLLALLASWKGYAAIGLLSALLGAGSASYVTALRYRLIITQMERDQANVNQRNSEAALAGFAAQTGRIQIAAQALASVQDRLGRRFELISKVLQDDITSHPLPSDCVPDGGRMHALSQAVAAANTATGAKPGPAMPGAD